MKKWQRKYVISAIILLFLGPILGLIQPISTNPPVANYPLAQSAIHLSSITVNSNTSLGALSNTVQTGEIDIVPADNIANVTVSNLMQVGSNGSFYVNPNGHILDFSLINSILYPDASGFNLQGSPSINGKNVSISGPLESNNYPITTIGAPILKLNNVNASSILLKMNGGTFIWNHSKTTNNGVVNLTGFTDAILDSDNLTDVWITGNGIVTIINTQIHGRLHESVKPTISPPITSYIVPFAFVFQPQVQVEIALGGLDNIRGPAYPLSYNLTIDKNGVPQPKITNILTDTYVLTIDTASTYTIHVICKDMQGNVATIAATITIVPQADPLWFILMIVIIAAAVVGAIALFFWRKQRQWQKTALVEIPG